METFYIVIVFFLLGLAVFDLYTGVSSAVVSFLPPAIGSKAAKLKTLLIIAGVGIVVGTATSSGMMDIARHGVLRPENYSYVEVMCVFLSVVCSDVIIIDIFNSLGMPTSTTVSMMFELFGGTTALALYKMIGASGGSLTYGTLVNTDKVLTVVMAIFLSVGIAFVVGTVVMWISRVVFTFQYKKHLKWSIGLFGAFSFASIMDFLLTKGFGQATFMTDSVKAWFVNESDMILLVLFVGSFILTQILFWLKVNVFKVIVIFGTFALAMAFAGNDLVNFIGVALAGLSSTQDFLAHGGGDPHTFMMKSLTLPAKTPVMYLIVSGLVMAMALFISKKARKVIGTTINLAKQGEGDEIFSTSRISRRLVRLTLNTTQTFLLFVPKRVREWVNSRFEKPDDEECGNTGAAFDLVRASVNLVLSGLLIVIGTSLQLPLSTTYVAFMVSMGSSLSDRAWGRESAVYRITGVISVIGGWFITAGGAFMLCFLVTSVMFFGGPVAMAVIVAVVLFLLIRSNVNFKEKVDEDERDAVYNEMIHCQDKVEKLHLLSEHIAMTHSRVLDFTKTCFFEITDGLMKENVKLLRKASNSIRDEKAVWLKSRQKEIVGMRMIDYYDAVKKNTWFHLGGNSVTQIIYCLKRMSDPCLEHVDNNFNPLPKTFIKEYTPIRDEVVEMFEKASEVIQNHEYEQIDALLVEGNDMKSRLSALRHRRENTLNKEGNSIRLDLLYLNTLQETQELASTLRHLLRATKRFNSQEDEIPLVDADE